MSSLVGPSFVGLGSSDLLGAVVAFYWCQSAVSPADSLNLNLVLLSFNSYAAQQVLICPSPSTTGRTD